MEKNVIKIKSEDKAALLNLLKTRPDLKNKIDLQNIDDKVSPDGIKYFEFSVPSEFYNEVKSILKNHPKINIIKTKNKMDNKKRMSKDELKEMIRQTLTGVLAEKKKVKDEDKKEKIEENEEQLDESLSGAESLIAGILGLGVPLGALIAAFVKAALKKGGPEAANELKKALDQSTGTNS